MNFKKLPVRKSKKQSRWHRFKKSKVAPTLSMSFSNGVNPSATVSLNALIWQKRAAGEKIYNLGVGEPMVNTSEPIKRAALKALALNQTHYPPSPGLAKLREMASQWSNASFGSSFSKTNTLVVSGAKFGLYLSLQALIAPGDEVLIPKPYWVSYPSIVKLFGGKSVFIPTSAKTGWKITADDILKRSGKKTKILILNNAGNPTGVLYNKNELADILAAAAKKNLTLISDEVYSGLVYDKNKFVSCSSFNKHQSRTIVLNSCSKNFAMTGWRIGFVFGPEQFISIINNLISQSTSGVNTLSQWGALEALTNSEKYIAQVKNEMRLRRNVFFKTFNKLFQTNLKPAPSALYAFVPLRLLGVREKNSTAFCRELLKKTNVAIVPGAAFGLEGYVRFSFGEEPKVLKQGLKLVKKFCGRQ